MFNMGLENIFKNEGLTRKGCRKNIGRVVIVSQFRCRLINVINN